MTAAAILGAIEQLQRAVDDVFKHADNSGFQTLSDDEFADAAGEVEAIRRQLATLDFPIVNEVESRALPDVELTRNAAGYVGKLWRLTPHEAAERVREAKSLGPRTALTGERMEPLRPVAAQARRLGILGDSQVSVILKTLHELPRDLAVHELDSAEQILVRAAHALHANDLRSVARQLLDTIDPDGSEPSADEQRRRRDLWLRPARDGMIRFGGTLDPVTGAKAQAWFGAMAKPRPDDATGRDGRTPGQRRHDAFADLLAPALRADEYASACGNPVVVHVTMTAEQFQTGTEHATTGYGQHIRVAESFRLLDQACVAWLVHNSVGGALNFGRGKRLASRDQAEALLARDGGCAFPSCDYPAQWCERHHVQEWRHGGRTDIANLVLLCSYHHARFSQHGWLIEMRDGVPWFIPPPLIDRDRVPIRNLRGLRASPFDP